MQANGQTSASPFTGPSALPGATPQSSPDKEYPMHWNTSGLALPSRTTTPALSAGRSTPQSDAVLIDRDQLNHLLDLVMNSRAGAPYNGGSASSSPGLPNLPPFSPAETHASLSSRPGTPDVSKPKRIPRPPNAFMLYRSHLLKTRQIPPNIEHRQQNISRVAGQSWNMLADEEKKKWHDKAKEVLTAHMAKHPGYKFSPERKSSRRKTLQDTEGPILSQEDYIRHLRETYLGMRGPAPKPARDRKRKSRREVDAEGPSCLSLPASLESSPASTPGTSYNMSAPSSVSSSPAIHPTTPSNDYVNMWQHPYDIPPFSYVPPPQEVLDQFASQNSQSSTLDDDVTPKASTFGDISLPSQPRFNFPPTFDFPEGTVAESHLGLHNMPPPSAPTGELVQDSSRPATPAQPQPPVFDPMWDGLARDPFNQNPTADASGSGLPENFPNSPFAPTEFGNFDFAGLNFSSIFSDSD